MDRFSAIKAFCLLILSILPIFIVPIFHISYSRPFFTILSYYLIIPPICALIFLIYVFNKIIRLGTFYHRIAHLILFLLPAILMIAMDTVVILNRRIFRGPDPDWAIPSARSVVFPYIVYLLPFIVLGYALDLVCLKRRRGNIRLADWLIIFLLGSSFSLLIIFVASEALY